MNLTIIILIITFILISAYIYYSNLLKENFLNNPNVTFLSEKNLENIICSNSDSYYDRFYQVDWSARKVNSLESYINLIKNNNVCSEFNLDEKERLTKLILQIDSNFKLNPNKILLPIDKLLSTPWNIGRCKGLIYEGGFPHTRNLNIILSDQHMSMADNVLGKILVHEKIHIFQKAYPDFTLQYLTLNNFKICGTRTPDSMIRVNPDTNDIIYINENNIIMSSKYNSMNPSNINDVSNISQRDEHPLEWMAIDLEEKFIS